MSASEESTAPKFTTSVSERLSHSFDPLFVLDVVNETNKEMDVHDTLTRLILW